MDEFSAEAVAIDARQSHTYAAEWGPDLVAFYVDDRAGQGGPPISVLSDAVHARHLRVQGRPGRIRRPREVSEGLRGRSLPRLPTQATDAGDLPERHVCRCRLSRAHRPADDGSTAGLRVRRLCRRCVARRPDDATSRGRRCDGREGDFDEHLQRFAEWGFPSFEVYFEVVPGSPLVYHAASDGIELELGVYDELVPGRPSFVLPVDEGLTRVTLPSDSLTHPLGRIDGVSIRTISPLALYQLRAASCAPGLRSPTAQGRSRAGPAPDKPPGEPTGGRARARVRSVPAIGRVSREVGWSGRRGSNSRPPIVGLSSDLMECAVELTISEALVACGTSPGIASVESTSPMMPEKL